MCSFINIYIHLQRKKGREGVRDGGREGGTQAVRDVALDH